VDVYKAVDSKYIFLIYLSWCIYFSTKKRSLLKRTPSVNMADIDKIFKKYREEHPDGYHAASFTAADRTGKRRFLYSLYKCVWLIVGKVLYSSSHGTLKVDGSGAPVTEDSIFWLASMTKIFTGAAAMIVVERGLITLDDDVSKIVPELAEPEILVGFEEGENGTIPISGYI
jgi:hypothetical protein